MKAVVTECFIDKNDNSIVYMIGDEVDFDEERIKDLSERKLVKCIEVPAPAKAKKRTSKK